MLTLNETAGRIPLTMTAQNMGKDFTIRLFGGETPHIGAVALAQPRESLRGDGSISASCSVLAVCGHKEDELARHVAISLAKRLNALVCVTCGIHMDAISPEEIAAVLEQVKRLVDDMADRLIKDYQGASKNC